MTYIEIIEKGFYGQIGEGNHAIVWILFMVLTALFAYLLGSISPVIILSKAEGIDDLYSRNEGGCTLTNLFQSCGKKRAVIGFLLEFLIGVLSATIGICLVGFIGGYFAGIFVVLGNALPLFFRFKGGKGVIVLLGTIAVMQTTVFLVMLGLMLALYIASKYVALGSVIAVAVMPLMINTWGCVQGFIIGFGNKSLVSGLCTLFAFASMGCVLFYHRKNIKRMWKNEEKKIDIFKGNM